MEYLPNLSSETHSISFHAGSSHFCLSSACSELLVKLELLFDRTAETSETTIVQNLDAPLPNMQEPLSMLAARNAGAVVDWVISNAFQSLAGSLWLDGSALVGRSNRKCLLVGPSHSGKSTLSLALTLRGIGKIISEDISFVNGDAELVPFIVPVSLRPNSIKLLQQTCNFDGEVVFDEWFYDASLFHRSAVRLPFDTVVLMNAVEDNRSEKLAAGTVDGAAVTKFLFSHSNALRLQDGVDRLNAAFNNAECISLSGGTLDERLELMATML